MTDAVVIPGPAKSRRARKAPPKDAEVIAFLAMIERAVCNPDIAIEKLDRMLAWRDEEKARLAAEAYNVAMTAAQAEMEPVRADCSNDHTHSRYASYAALNAKVRPVFTRHGFSLTFNTEPAPLAEQVRVVCTVRNGAHAERHQIDMPVDGKGVRDGPVMTKTHAMGSGVTYGRRYLLGMIFDLAVTKDDDGNAAGQSAPFVQAPPLAPRPPNPMLKKLPPRPEYDNPLGAGPGRPPTIVESPAAKLKAEMAAVAAAKPASPGLEAAIADMTPNSPAKTGENALSTQPAMPALMPRRHDPEPWRTAMPPDPPPNDGLDIPDSLRRR